MAGGKTFSESWHRIVDQKISLRSTVKVRRQLFRGQRWYVLHDPFTNEFFRLRPEAHDFVMRLRPDRPSLEKPTEALYAKQLGVMQVRRNQLLEDRRGLTIVSSYSGRVARVAPPGSRW